MSAEPKRYPRLKREQYSVERTPEEVENGGGHGSRLDEMVKEKAGKETSAQPEAHPAPTPHAPPSLPLEDADKPRLSPLYRGGPMLPLQNLKPEKAAEIPPTEHAADREVKLSLARCQALALRQIEHLLQHVDQLPIDVLLEVVARIGDMRLTVEWTERLEQAIEQNPSRLTPPGNVRSPLLNKLKTLASKRRQEEKRDGRTSGAKLNRTGTDHEFPAD